MIKYIHAVKGSLAALVIFSLIAILMPEKEQVNDKVEIILTVSTFLFAILTGFFLSRLNDRYNQIREVTAAEDAAWTSLYRMAPAFGKNFVKKISKIIDKYYIVAFDFDVGNYYKHNTKYFNQIYSALMEIKISTPKIDNLFDDMFSLLLEIEHKRNKSSVLASEKLTMGQWLVLLFLAGMIMLSIFSLDTVDIYYKIAAVIFSTTLVLILLTLRDLQNLRHGGQLLAVESGQEVFEFIGELRYYNQEYIETGLIKIPENIKEYRLGLHKPGGKFKIKVVKNKQ